MSSPVVSRVQYTEATEGEPVFIKIAHNRSWTHGGNIYEHGIHEVEAFVADRAQVLANRFEWKWLTVHATDPGAETLNPNARAGVLTAADVNLGTDGAAQAKVDEDAAAVADAAEAAARRAAAVATADDAPKPFPCEHDGCEETFPTKAARTRHQNLNHAAGDGAEPVAASEMNSPATVEEPTASDDDAPQNDDNAPEGDKE